MARTATFLLLAALAAFPPVTRAAEAVSVVQPGSADGRLVVRATPGCSGGIVYDDGSFEAGYGPGEPATDASFVMHFAAGGGGLLEQLCLCWSRHGGDDTIEHDLVVLDDDGPGGGPGTEWDRIPVSTVGVPAAPGAAFFGYDLVGLDVNLPPGGYYLGVSDWNAVNDPDFLLCADQDGPGGRDGYYAFSGINWMEMGTTGTFPDYRALGVRAELQASGTDCAADVDTLCLRDDRFQVEVEWRDNQDRVSAAKVVPGVQSDDSGLFYFRDPDNWEFLVKVLNGCSINGRFWVFFAATTNVEFTLTVVDTATGASTTYDNPAGQPADAVTDTRAFPCS